MFTRHAECTFELMAFITTESADHTKWMRGLGGGRWRQRKAAAHLATFWNLGSRTSYCYKRKMEETLRSGTKTEYKHAVKNIYARVVLYVKICFHTFAARQGFAPLPVTRTLDGVRSLQFKACCTAEAAGGAWTQLRGRITARGDQVIVSHWILTCDC